jgi:hypothetical protein
MEELAAWTVEADDVLTFLDHRFRPRTWRPSTALSVYGWIGWKPSESYRPVPFAVMAGGYEEKAPT